MIENLWAFVGTIYLVYLTWQDYKNKMMVDDRLNYFMMGTTLMILSVYSHGVWYIIAGAIFTILLLAFLGMNKALGDADLSSLAWIIMGFFWVDYNSLVYFGITFIGLVVIYGILKFAVFRIKAETPFYPILLISFFLSTLWLGWLI